jgi:hypothetical protein
MAWKTRRNTKKIKEFRERFKALVCDDYDLVDLADIQAQVSRVMFGLIHAEGRLDGITNPPKAKSAAAGK